MCGGCGGTSYGVPTRLQQRRQTLYQQLVTPVEVELQNTGWSEPRTYKGLETNYPYINKETGGGLVDGDHFIAWQADAVRDPHHLKIIKVGDPMPRHPSGTSRASIRP